MKDLTCHICGTLFGQVDNGALIVRVSNGFLTINSARKQDRITVVCVCGHESTIRKNKPKEKALVTKAQDIV